MGDHRLYSRTPDEPVGTDKRRATRRTSKAGAAEAMNFDRWQKNAWIVGIAGLVLAAVGLVFSRDQFFRSYLWAFLFWFGIGMGCLPLLMLYHLVGGAWGFTIRRIVECGARTIPVMAILFLPILFGVHNLYEWSHADRVASDEVLQQKHLYLN